MFTASSPAIRLTVCLQRSLGGSEYPEQLKNTPVPAVLIIIGRPQTVQSMPVSEGTLGLIPLSASLAKETVLLKSE